VNNYFHLLLEHIHATDGFYVNGLFVECFIGE
jgi:hypothetical protein